MWGDKAIELLATFQKILQGQDVKLIFFDLWSDETVNNSQKHWPAGIRLCNVSSVSLIVKTSKKKKPDVTRRDLPRPLTLLGGHLTLCSKKSGVT